MEKLSLLEVVCIALVFCAATAIASPAQVLFTTLYIFDYRSDGGTVYAGLVQGTDGNFYGATEVGGASGNYGTVFKITPAGTLTTLHSFDGTDGFGPAATLVQGTDGNFYGTTLEGGASGEGTVFKITPSGMLTTLHSFGITDGDTPYGALVQARDGNFYGTTAGGGTSGNCGSEGCGTVFKISPGGTLTTLYSFCAQNNCPDGDSPFDALVQATDGNFYGTTAAGGTSGNCGDYGCGTIFKVTPNGTLTTLHSFDGTDGGIPFAGLLQATDGNLYGTTSSGGVYGQGTVLKITPGGTLTTLYSFCSDQYLCADGAGPRASLVQATDGNFYGTTSAGGGGYGAGTVFKITPGGTLTTLHSFSIGDGANPAAALVQGRDRNFYGTTESGGPYRAGTVFQLISVRACFSCPLEWR